MFEICHTYFFTVKFNVLKSRALNTAKVRLEWSEASIGWHSKGSAEQQAHFNVLVGGVSSSKTPDGLNTHTRWLLLPSYSGNDWRLLLLLLLNIGWRRMDVLYHATTLLLNFFLWWCELYRLGLHRFFFHSTFRLHCQKIGCKFCRIF